MPPATHRSDPTPPPNLLARSTGAFRATCAAAAAKYATRGFAVAVPGLPLDQVDVLHAMSTPLSELKGVSRLVHMHAVLQNQYHRHMASRPGAIAMHMPSLRKLFGRVKYFSGYGGEIATWNGVRALPADEADAQALSASVWFQFTTEPSTATEDNPNSSAWVLVVPCRELDEEMPELWRGMLPIMDAATRSAHWAVILDAGRDNLRIPRLLTWASGPLNPLVATIEKSGPQLERDYFETAFKKRGA